MRFVLASASPARLRTLRDAGTDPEVVVSGFDEDAVTAPSTRELVTLLATGKARVVADQVGDDALVLGCDSLLDLDGVGLGKPGSPDAARERWLNMRDRTGTLWTGHRLIDTATGRTAVRSIGTTVHFADVSDDEITTYAATGEPSAVAGAFTIDGLGGWFVDSIEGDHHNVVGVSLAAVRAMLCELGHDLATIGWPNR